MKQTAIKSCIIYPQGYRHRYAQIEQCDTTSDPCDMTFDQCDTALWRCAIRLLRRAIWLFGSSPVRYDFCWTNAPCDMTLLQVQPCDMTLLQVQPCDMTCLKVLQRGNGMTCTFWCVFLVSFEFVSWTSCVPGAVSRSPACREPIYIHAR
jgi:hypothetical protein